MKAAVAALLLAGCAEAPTVYPAEAWPIVSRYAAAATPSGHVRDAPHNGVDIVAPLGTPVLAVADGTVTAVKEEFGNSGTVIYQSVETDRGERQVRYAHLQRAGVAKGQRVRAGQAIGAVGRTGDWVEKNEPPHLHLAVLGPFGRDDPERWLRGADGRVNCGDGEGWVYPVACLRNGLLQ